jgi:hypothetical protein
MCMLRVCGLLWCCCTALLTSAQPTASGNSFPVLHTPPSPEVANLGKFTEQPVQLAAGTPQIGVPLHTIRIGDFEWPIGLQYQAGGVRVEEMAGSCGLNWSISALSTISRMVRGNRDEYPGEGYMDNPFTYDSVNRFYLLNKNNNGLMNPSLVNFIGQVSQGQIDLEPDVFQYQLPGSGGGSFFISRGEKQVHTKEFSRLRFSYDRSDIPGVQGSFSQWRITDDRGCVYIFGKALTDTSAAIEKTVTQQIANGSRGANMDQYSAWLLRAIILPRQTDTLYVDYLPLVLRYNHRLSETRYENESVNFAVPDEYVYSESRAFTFQPLTIRGRFGRVQFVYAAAERLDLKGGRALSRVEVYDAAQF